MLFDSIKYIYCQSAEEEEWIRKGAPKVGDNSGPLACQLNKLPAQHNTLRPVAVLFSHVNSLICFRCSLTTVDPDKGVISKDGEPLKSLRK